VQAEESRNHIKEKLGNIPESILSKALRVELCTSG